MKGGHARTYTRARTHAVRRPQLPGGLGGATRHREVHEARGVSCIAWRTNGADTRGTQRLRVADSWPLGTHALQEGAAAAQDGTRSSLTSAAAQTGGTGSPRLRTMLIAMVEQDAVHQLTLPCEKVMNLLIQVYIVSMAPQVEGVLTQVERQEGMDGP